MTALPQHIAETCRELLALWPELDAHHERPGRRPRAQQQPDPERDELRAAQDAIDRYFRHSRTGKIAILPGVVNWHGIEALDDSASALCALESAIRTHLGDNARKPVGQARLDKLDAFVGHLNWLGQLNSRPHGPHLPGQTWTGRPARAQPANTAIATYERETPTAQRLNATAALRYLATAVWRIRTPQLLDQTADQLNRTHRAIRSALGDPPRARWLGTETRCPYCEQASMYVFDAKDDPTPESERPANWTPPPAYMRCCTNPINPHAITDQHIEAATPGDCLCPAGREQRCADRCHLGGRHTWPEDDWLRLAEVLYRHVTSERQGRKKLGWTKPEIATVADETLRDFIAARLLGRSIVAVRTKREQLGIEHPLDRQERIEREATDEAFIDAERTRVETNGGVW